ncbi:hypothetical protein [Aquimarina sediminis]|uniref:hypothetical protein n=1 Tax=Aquimarina sediminis TaxID=2070536 RepID=UPI000CA01956|nr:hypothetical protein [Aquimarina sediminis]
MISIALSSSIELKAILTSQKEKFNQYRIGNTKTIEIIEKTEEKESSVSIKSTNSGNATESTKTYTEKIKGGYFGRRRSRY